jgi:hypothetical protein
LAKGGTRFARSVGVEGNAYDPRLVLAAALALTITPGVIAQQAPPRFGGSYDSLDARQQRLIDDWVVRFNATTGQKVAAGPFYDEVVSLSTKVTFDAITNALLSSSLTERARCGARRCPVAGESRPTTSKCRDPS